jgi:hypothetical protein
MCGFYDDKQKIRKGDEAIYQGQNVTIQKTTHIKDNKTMDIVYLNDNNDEKIVNIPYQTTGYGFELKGRDEKI